MRRNQQKHTHTHTHTQSSRRQDLAVAIAPRGSHVRVEDPEAACGEVQDQAKFAEYDELFMEALSTFRPISSREIAGRKPKTIHYVKATSATTFDKLGEALKLSKSELEDLRLINGYYPDGEPGEGEWIKIFQQ